MPVPLMLHVVEALLAAPLRQRKQRSPALTDQAAIPLISITINTKRFILPLSCIFCMSVFCDGSERVYLLCSDGANKPTHRG